MSTNTSPSLPAASAPGRTLAAWWQALPLTTVFVLFFLIPLALVLMVSFWDYNQYEMLPGFTFKNYVSVFEGCLSRNESADLLEAVLNKISETLAHGETVKISSFGSFSVRNKGQRVGRNPKTGEEVPILPRRVLVFRPSQVLKSRISEPTPGSSSANSGTSGSNS